MPHFLEDVYNMTKVTKRLPGGDGKTFELFVDGDKNDLPYGFPYGPLLRGFQFPPKVDLELVTVVVDPWVTKDCSITEETRKENSAMQELLKRYKGKKRATANPSFYEPPSDLPKCARFYRSITMHHQGKEPVLFIGFDFSSEHLNAEFWRKAMTLKNRIQLPKAPVPNGFVNGLYKGSTNYL